MFPHGSWTWQKWEFDPTHCVCVLSVWDFWKSVEDVCMTATGKGCHFLSGVWSSTMHDTEWETSSALISSYMATELLLDLRKSNFWKCSRTDLSTEWTLMRDRLFTDLRRSSSFLRSLMSLCTTCSTWAASQSERPDRSSFRPMAFKTLPPNCLIRNGINTQSAH